MERRETAYTVGGNVNWYSHYGEQYGFLKKTENRANILPFHPSPGHISRGKHDMKGYIHPSVHCSPVYNSQDMEAT